MSGDQETNGSETHGWRLKQLEAKVDELLRVVNGIELSMARLATRKECPNPGMCIELAKDIEELEKVVAHHENILSFSKGYLAAAASLGGIIGGVVSLVGGRLFG